MPLEYNKAAAPARGAETVEVNRSSVAVAVERYLAARGVSVTAQPNGQPGKAAAVSNVAVDLVDRFLAARSVTVQPAAPANRQPEKADLVSRVVDAVNRVLAARATTAPAAPASQPVKASVVSNVEDVVDRFLATRAATVPPDPPAPAPQPVKAAVIPNVAAAVVDQFLLGHGSGPASGFS
jgi:hypothetical protein